MFKPENIRKDFPIFDNFQKDNGESLVYLDSASSSQTPETVLLAMNRYYTEYRSNIDRGSGVLASRSTEEFEAVRKKVAEFISASTEEVVFTHGATDAANLIVFALKKKLNLGVGDRIVTTVADHHSNLLPLQMLAAESGAELVYIPLKDNLDLDYNEAEKLITPRTKLVSMPLVSNVLGTIFDVKRVVLLAVRQGAKTIVDATSAAGHVPLNVKDFSADALYFGAHKMCGPTGVGILYVREDLLSGLEPVSFGGGTIDSVTKDGAVWRKGVKRFEAGTPNIAGVIGFGAALDYLDRVGINVIKTHVQDLVGYALKEIEKIPGVSIYAQKDPKKNAGIVSFSLGKVHPHDVAEILSQEGVAIRAGHHCAEPLMTELGVKALSRASLYFYNGKDDVDALIAGIKKVKEKFGLIN